MARCLAGVVREKIRGVTSEPLHVISSMATRELLRELARRYETATGQAVVTEAAGGVDVAKRVERGDALEVWCSRPTSSIG